MLQASTILHLQDQATHHWHTNDPTPTPTSPFESLLQHHHRANFDLWHEEDDARSPDASDARIAQVKHAIDRLNQRRNDLVEQIDELLLVEAAPQDESAPLHSETPGLILDRLSILALKLFHTAAEAHRSTASEAHRTRNLQRLHILEQQRNDLALCLDALWQDILAGRRRFHLYRQMKMYNDPDLNPVLYERASKPSNAPKGD